MVRQDAKDILFAFNRYAALLNLPLARLRFRRPPDPEGFYLHLGCGVHYIPGMINADGNLFRRTNLWIDLRNRLPFRDGSVHFIYCSHTIEHLYPNDAVRALTEMRRVLNPGGVARVVVPSFEHALDIVAGRKYAIWPRHHREKMGEAINWLFCDGQHKYGYSWGVLDEFAQTAGFTRRTRVTDNPTANKQYGKVTVGGEMDGSLVAELGHD